MLIDTGHSVKENCAIGRELHKLLGVGFSKLGGNKIGIANPNSKIKSTWSIKSYQNENEIISSLT